MCSSLGRPGEVEDQYASRVFTPRTSRARGTRVRLIRRWPDTVVAVIAVVVLPVLAATTLDDARTDHWQTDPVALTIVLSIMSWLIWNVGVRSRVVVWSTGVDVINGFVRYWLPWSSIDTSESTADVVIRLQDGSHVRPFATLGSPAGAVLGSRHQRKTLALLDSERADVPDESVRPQRRRYRPGLVSLVVTAGWVVLLGFA
jgi:hypothetical protein